MKAHRHVITIFMNEKHFCFPRSFLPPLHTKIGLQNFFGKECLDAPHISHPIIVNKSLQRFLFDLQKTDPQRILRFWIPSVSSAITSTFFRVQVSNSRCAIDSLSMLTDATITAGIKQEHGFLTSESSDEDIISTIECAIKMMTGFLEEAAHLIKYIISFYP